MTACGETCVNLAWGWTKTKFHMCDGRCVDVEQKCDNSVPVCQAGGTNHGSGRSQLQ